MENLPACVAHPGFEKIWSSGATTFYRSGSVMSAVGVAELLWAATCLIAVKFVHHVPARFGTQPPKPETPLPMHLICAAMPPEVRPYVHQLVGLGYMAVICAEEIMFRSWPRLYYGPSTYCRVASSVAFGLMHVPNVWTRGLWRSVFAFWCTGTVGYILCTVDHLPYTILLHAAYNARLTYACLKCLVTWYKENRHLTQESGPRLPTRPSILVPPTPA